MLSVAAEFGHNACMTTYQPLPAGGAATLLRALFKGAGPAGSPAPLSTHYALPRIDAARLARYNELLGFAAGDLPVTFYYLLAQRAQLTTMLDERFPFRVVGMVHVENAIREQRRADLALPLMLHTRVEVEPAKANGARYCELMTEGIQQGATVFECRSRYLAVRGQRQGAREGASEGAAEAASPDAVRKIAEWALTSASGRDYASVSGDWNPIHLWPWSARLMGMQAPIIHGMHTVAKACALLQRQEGRRLTEVSARFRAPIVLGARVELRLAEPAGSYQAWSGGKAAVEGSFG